jgi:hypothetical protein
VSWGSLAVDFCRLWGPSYYWKRREFGDRGCAKGHQVDRHSLSTIISDDVLTNRGWERSDHDTQLYTRRDYGRETIIYCSDDGTQCANEGAVMNYVAHG